MKISALCFQDLNYSPSRNHTTHSSEESVAFGISWGMQFTVLGRLFIAMAKDKTACFFRKRKTV